MRGFRSSRHCGNLYNQLLYEVVGNSVYRMWESCHLTLPYSVNGFIHAGIACYAHFYNVCLLVFDSEYCGAGGLSLIFIPCFFTKHEHLLKTHIHCMKQAAILLLRNTAACVFSIKICHIKALSKMVQQWCSSTTFKSEKP